MQKLPIRPTIFYLAFWLPFLSLTLISSVMGTIPGFVVEIWAAGSMLLYLIWIYQALNFLSNLAISEGESRRLTLPVSRARQYLTVFSVGYVLAWFLGLFFRPILVEGTMVEFIFGIFGAAIALSFFALFWMSSRALCEAEASPRPDGSKFLGTFLQLLHLPIAALFIYRRLVKLGGILPSGVAIQG